MSLQASDRSDDRLDDDGHACREAIFEPVLELRAQGGELAVSGPSVVPHNQRETSVITELL
jgi:hypothetical protein